MKKIRGVKTQASRTAIQPGFLTYQGVPGPGGLGLWQSCSKQSLSGHLPNNEVRVSLLHDEFLRTNVLLLSRVDYVPLFQDLHGKGFVFIALELNLQTGNKERQQPVIQLGFFFFFWLNQCHRYTAVPPTSSTRPKPPTPRVSMMLKSARLRLKKNAFSASYLSRQEKRENVGMGLKMTWRIKEEIIQFQHPET